LAKPKTMLTVFLISPCCLPRPLTVLPVFKRAAFYQPLKSKVGLAATKAAALRIILNVECGGIVGYCSNKHTHAGTAVINTHSLSQAARLVQMAREREREREREKESFIRNYGP